MLKKMISILLAAALVVSSIGFTSDEVEAASIEVNYGKLLQESLYFFDANMCGQKVSERSAFSRYAGHHGGSLWVCLL